jgi:hypothetical protein
MIRRLKKTRNAKVGALESSESLLFILLEEKLEHIITVYPCRGIKLRLSCDAML